MIDQFIGFVEILIQTHGPLGVFFAAFIEEIIAPIPSGLVMLSAGYAFLSGQEISFISMLQLLVKVVIPLATGLTIGSLLIYGITYHWGENIIRKYGKYLGLSWQDVDKLHRKFDKSHSDEIILLGLRIIPIIPSIAINTVAGILKIPFKEYVIFTLIGVSIRSFIMSFIGWQVGNVYKEYAVQIDHFENYVLYILIALFIGFVLWKKYGKKRQVL